MPKGNIVFGAQIRWLRKHRGLTQTELARLIRVRRRAPSPSYISRLEAGKLSPDLAVIRSLAAALGVKPWYLLAELTANLEFWDSYLTLKGEQKRAVQRHIRWLQKRGQ